MSSIKDSQSSTPSNPSQEDVQTITKKMSQLIAKSWLPGGEEIRKILLSNNSEEIKKMLKKHNISLELLGDIKIEVDWSTFLGRLEDATNSLKLVIAYPPRPSEYNLSDSDIEEWVNNEDPNQKVPSHAYIPVTF